MDNQSSKALGVGRRSNRKQTGAGHPTGVFRWSARARSIANAVKPIVETLEVRHLMAGDSSVVQSLPYLLEFDAPVAGGILDKDGEGTGFTWVMPNKDGNEYQASLIDLVGGRLRITTTGNATAGGPWENDNTLVNALQTQFNGSAGSFSISTRLVGPLGFINNPSEQGGLLFGPDQDNHVKLVAVSQPNGTFLQFIDEQKPSTTFVHQIPTANSYTNIGSFANINTLDLTIAGDASTGLITAFYRVNGGQLQQVSQTLTLSGAQKTKFFSAAARAGLIAMQKNNLPAETLVFENFSITSGTPTVARPSVLATQTQPEPGATNVKRDSFVSVAVSLPNVGKGVDSATLTSGTVKLYRTSDKQAVAGHSSTSGAGDTITFQPHGPLAANTQYTFEVTSGVKDTSGASFVPFTMSFTTGTLITPTDPDIAFQKVSLPTATGQMYSGVTIGPDGKLYATTLSGLIQRFTINSDGSLGAAQNITTVQGNNGGARFITSLTFDPASTANNLIAYVSHGFYAFENAPDFSGKIARLTGANLENYQELIVGLPRAVRDHLNNQLNFGPDGALYFAQGSSSAMGAADAAWGLRPEHLLTGAVLRVDMAKINQRIASGLGALDVRTENNSTGTNYNPFAVNAPLTIYATGVRNAYDLVWTRDGKLYAPTNGSAAGGNAPAQPTTFSGTRIDESINGPYSASAVAGLNNIGTTAADYLFKIEAGGYYGHPNPTRGEFILNGGNPTDLVDPGEFTQYPTGTQPDRNYRGAAYTFGKNHSPNGVIEYQGAFLNGKLDGKLLVVRYSGGADVVALGRDANGNVTGAEYNISGLTGFINPLDLTQDRVTGNLYIADYGAQALYLARPVAAGARISSEKQTYYFNDDFANSNTTASPTQKIRIHNTGTAPLVIPSTTITLSSTTNWVITSKPTLPATVAPGDYVEVGVAFRATTATGAGVKTATLTIASNDATTPSLTIALRGLAAPATGGMNEPSLQRILQLYEIPVVTGDSNASTTNLFSNTEPLNTPNDEVRAQRFVKAGSGNVTIEPLAVYAGGSPAVKFGYYQAGTAGYKTELLSVASADAQSVNPTLLGTTSFDPGASRFGLYAYYAIFDNTAYSEDSLNTKENTASARRKFRFYPLKNADGSVVPNAYIFTSEDYNNDPAGATDANDFVGIIRNVSIANDGPEFGVENLDGNSIPDRLVFNRIQVQPPDPKLDTVTGQYVPVPNNVVHDTSVLRIRNTGDSPLTITSLAVNNTSVWQIINPPAAGTTVAAGGYLDLTVKFVAQSLPSWPGFNPTIDPSGQASNFSGFYNGTLTIGTNDADEPTNTVQLAGWWQQKSEKNQEPSLPVIVNNLFGYKTKITNTGQSMYTLDGSVTTIGEEVLSRYWVRADGSAPVTVRQLAAFHSQGSTATVRWAPYGSPGSLTPMLVHDAVDGQSILPRVNGGTSVAVGTFKPTTNATTNPLGAFQFKIDQEWSDDTMNNPVANNPNDQGHHVRFWPARDKNGNLIPNTWIMGMDYLGINYDYQDNVYLVTNMKPMQPGAPSGLTASAQTSGIALDWSDLTGAPLLAGYNVYRSTTSTGPWDKLNGDPVAASQYLDSTATAGVTYYYRVTAADSWQSESNPSNVVNAMRTQDTVPPATPSGLTATGVGNGVALSWLANPDTDMAGYRVFRSNLINGAYTALNGGNLVTTTGFTDTTAAVGTTWFYKIVAVDTSSNESGQSSAATATAGDTVAPSAPAGLAAATDNAGIKLNWSAVAASDLAGYRVYRSATADGTFSLVSGGSLVAGVTWTDTSAQISETWHYRVTAVDLSGNESTPSDVASATRTVPMQPTIRINVGGSAYTDGGGNVWQADQYFSGGTATTSNFDVAGTTDDALYLARRYGAYTYAIPVANGRYTLNLHLMDPLYTTAGMRLFSVVAEGTTILNNFDIAANGGGKTKLVRSFTVNVTDGVLNLQTIKNIENPIISGIELIPQTTAPAGPAGVVASQLLNGARVTWTASSSPTPTGYNVYRASTVDGTYAKVNGTTLVAGTSYTDTSLAAGQAAYYKVTAVYSGGLESDFSTVVPVAARVAGTGTGLMGRYYAGNNFNTLKLTRTDPTLNFDWASNSPNPSVPVDNFSVRWTGFVQAPVAGDYTFSVRVGDAVKVWINGQLVINKAAAGSQEYSASAITLTAGQKYSIQIDYSELTGAASAKLYWSMPGMNQVIIPKQYLYTA